jgi:hypothetical protein
MVSMPAFFEMLTYILDHGADPNQTSESGATALYHFLASPAILKGADEESTQSRRTLEHWKRTLSILVRYGADFSRSLQSSSSLPPLFHINFDRGGLQYQRRLKEIYTALFDEGLDPNVSLYGSGLRCTLWEWWLLGPRKNPSQLLYFPLVLLFLERGANPSSSTIAMSHLEHYIERIGRYAPRESAALEIALNSALERQRQKSLTGWLSPLIGVVSGFKFW